MGAVEQELAADKASLSRTWLTPGLRQAALAGETNVRFRRIMTFNRIFWTLMFFACLGMLLGFSPYWTIHELEGAVRTEDAIAIADHVDMDRLRENVKSLIQAELAKDEEGEESAGAAIFSGIASFMVGPAVDNFVTPHNLIKFFSGEGDLDSNQQKTNSGHPRSGNGSREMKTKSMGYRGYSRFEVELDAGEAFGDYESVFLVFNRYGLLNWKLVGIYV